jgi:hypothetical protein
VGEAYVNQSRQRDADGNAFGFLAGLPIENSFSLRVATPVALVLSPPGLQEVSIFETVLILVFEELLTALH